MIKNIFLVIKKYRVILFIIFLGILLYVPYFSSNVHSDEGGYLFRGNSIANGANLYKDYPTSKVPGLFYLLGFVFLVFGRSLFIARALLLTFHVMTAIVLYAIGKKLWNEKIGILSSVTYLIGVSLPTMYVHYVLMEPFMNFFSLLGIFFFFHYREQQKQRYLVFSGIFIGISALFKQPGIFTFLSILFFYIVGLYIIENRTKQYITKSFKEILFLFLGLLLPIIIIVFQLWFTSSLDSFIEYAIMLKGEQKGHQSLALVNPIRPYFAYIFLSYSFIWVPSIISFLIILKMFLKRRIVDKNTFLAIWIILSLVPSMRVLNSHYFVQAFPPACLLASLILLKIKLKPILRNEKLAIEYKKLATMIILGMIVFVSIIANAHFQLFVQNKETTPLSEQREVANYIKSHTSEDEKIFAFEKCPWVYFLSDRESAVKRLYFRLSNLNSSDINETIEQIKKNNVRYLVVYHGVMYKEESNITHSFYRFIESNYEIEKSYNRIDIYIKK